MTTTNKTPLYKTLLFCASIIAANPAAFALSYNSAAAHWRFDEGSGITAFDANGTLDGTLINGASWTSGKYGGALQLDGIDDFVNAAGASALNVGSGSSTFSAWIKTPGSGDIDFVASLGQGGDFALRSLGIKASGTVDVRVEGITSGQVTSSDDGASSVDDGWHHIAVVFDRSTNQMIRYVDGAQTGTVNSLAGLGTSSTDTAAPFQIGALQNNVGIPSNFFLGAIDEVAVWNTALTGAEVAELASMAPVPLPAPALLFGSGLVTLLIRKRRAESRV